MFKNFFNKNKKYKKIKLSKSKNKIFTYKKEVLGIILFSLFAIVTLAFLSYNPTDKSWFYFSSGKYDPANWVGIAGAQIAALFFYFFGSAAYVFNFFILFLATVLFFKKPFKQEWDRFLALFLILISTSTFLRIYELDFTKSFPGGLLGDILLKSSLFFLETLGTKIFIFTTMFVGIIIFFRISFAVLLQTIFEFTWYFSKFISIKFFEFCRIVSIKLFEFSKLLSQKFLVLLVIGSKFCWDKIWQLFKSQPFSRKKKQQDKEDEFFFANLPEHKDVQYYKVESEIEDDKLWESLAAVAKVMAARENIAQKGEKEVENKFKDKQIFTNSHFLNFLKYKTQFLPNSCFKKNIFSRDFISKLNQVSIHAAKWDDPLRRHFVAPPAFASRVSAGVRDKRTLRQAPVFAKASSDTQGERNKRVYPAASSSSAEGSRTMNHKSFKQRIEYQLPDMTIFQETKSKESWIKELEQESIERGKKLEEKLSYFGVKGKVTAIRPGPVITLFEYKPEIDSKISKIVALEDDLAMALTALSIRIVAPIPGKNVIGFEISNQNRQNVFLSDILLSKEFKISVAKLPLSLGVDIVGKPVMENLVKMPHLLVAGSTGSGKSVGMNCMLVSLLCRLRPDQLRVILIDPKRLEFAPYADIPHLLFPIIINPRQAAPVLKWLVQEMEDRYDKLSVAGVKNIVEYQKLAVNSDEYENMPFIVLIIDELADLMMVAGKEIEIQVARIAQMARAAGIHMIVATQRPSVDVVTGIIKVNFPSRIAYRVSSKIDSRTIIDDKGAEKLLGLGDLLYMNSVSSDLKRIHGAYISDKEIEKLTTHLKSQQKVEYLDLNETLRKVAQKDLQSLEDELYPKVLEFLKTQDEISISQLQRCYKIGFNRSARIIERLELDGIIAPAQGSKPRRVVR